MRWSLAGLFVCGLPVACADPCIDDGLGQAGEGNCPQASASQTDGQTDSNGDTDTVTATMGTTMGPNTDGMTGSQTGTTDTVGETLDGTSTIGETETASATDTSTTGETDTAGGTLWCVDADEDGYGDPDMCQQSDEPVPGSVDNGDDCDDTNESTYPGAAPNDDPRACMQDVDGDDWGDDGMGGDPLPPGVIPGTDCLDDDGDIFPGTAENETPPDLCAQDQDDDGYGDTDPPPGADPGTDCADDDASIFPGAAENETPPDLCAEDGDEDGWGDTDPPPGVEPGTDCDDSNPDIRPGAAENEPDLCAEDIDDDGYGDSNPPPGVDAGTDCDDGNLFTFPGAAPNDDALACMQDEDEDNWGDDLPPPGVVPGTDCDDSNPDAFPGAAPNETPSDLCTIDADGDGYGDANPGPGGGGGSGPQSGSDCYDTNVDLNPDTLQLTAFLPFNGTAFAPRVINTVDEATGALGAFVTLLTPAGGIPDANIVTATFNENMEIYANDLTAPSLYTVDYELTCGGGLGEAATVGMPYGVPGVDIVCGLEFGDSGTLYGISHNLDQLLTFDEATGQVTGGVDLLTPAGANVDIFSCGMARDCTEGRLLVANGIDHTIYSVDEATGTTEVLRDLNGFPGLPGGTWSPVGLEYDPVSQTAFLSTGGALYQVDLDNAVAPTFIAGFPQQVSNLQYLPICTP